MEVRQLLGNQTGMEYLFIVAAIDNIYNQDLLFRSGVCVLIV